MGVETESHLQFIDGLGRDAGGKDLEQPFEGIMIALQPADAFFDRQAGLHGVLYRANAGQCGQIAVRLVSLHSKPGIENNLAFNRPETQIQTAEGRKASEAVKELIF